MAGYELTEALETERLLLRAHTAGDFEALYAMRSDPEVARHLYWGPQTEDDVRETLEKKIASSSTRSSTASGDRPGDGIGLVARPEP